MVSLQTGSCQRKPAATAVIGLTPITLRPPHPAVSCPSAKRASSIAPASNVTSRRTRIPIGQRLASVEASVPRRLIEVTAVAKRSALEERLRVTFKNSALLQQALTHSSYLNEHPHVAAESNERLEFLGDAVLGLVIAGDLYGSYPGLDEGKLTELRTHLVRGGTLAKAARRLKLGDEISFGRGEEAAGGRGRPSNLAHAYEAIVGAIYLDSGIRSARSFIRRSLKPEYQLVADEAFPMDAKSLLQEISQSRFQSAPRYLLVKEEGPDHARLFTFEVRINGRRLGTGSGRSKQDAEKEAAQKALQRLESEEAGMSGGCT